MRFHSMRCVGLLNCIVFQTFCGIILVFANAHINQAVLRNYWHKCIYFSPQIHIFFSIFSGTLHMTIMAIRWSVRPYQYAKKPCTFINWQNDGNGCLSPKGGAGQSNCWHNYTHLHASECTREHIPDISGIYPYCHTDYWHIAVVGAAFSGKNFIDFHTTFFLSPIFFFAAQLRHFFTFVGANM